MASKRMISTALVDRDQFLEMSMSAQLLYFHANMRADDDGFIDKLRSLARSIGCTKDDIAELEAEGMIYLFPSGVCVIRHWHASNTIRKDTYVPTIYQEELAMIENVGGVYCWKAAEEPCSDPVTDTVQVRDESVTDTVRPCNEPVSLDKDIVLDKDIGLGEVSKNHSYTPGSSLDNKPKSISCIIDIKPCTTLQVDIPENTFIPPTLDEVRRYVLGHSYTFDPQIFLDYYTERHWLDARGKPIENWRACAVTWQRNEKKRAAAQHNYQQHTYTAAEDEKLFMKFEEAVT